MTLGHMLCTTALCAGVAFGSQALATPLARGSVVQAVAPTTQVSFEVFLPLRNKAALESLLQAQQTPGSNSYHVWLTPKQFAAQFGPDAATMAAAQSAAGGAGLTVTETHSRSFHVVGDAQHVGAFLGTKLNSVTSPGAAARIMAAGKPALPAALQQAGAQVVAFSGIPPRHVYSKRTATPVTDNRYSAEGAYWFDDLKQAYDYPAYEKGRGGAPIPDGTGVKVAVLMADLLYPNDVANFFNHENFAKLAKKPVPTVTTVAVDGGGVINGYGSVEASLDVQQVLGGAPGASVTLISIPDLSDQSIIDGYTYIVEKNKFDIVNSSFGECELFYTSDYNDGTDYTYILQTYHEIFAQGNSEGITFVASSGDEAGLLCPNVAGTSFIPGVSSPADDTDVTAVGGGNLITTYSTKTLNSAYVGENGIGDPEEPYDAFGTGDISGGYWGAGGGISAIFTKPSYQNLVNTGSGSYRTLPDVGMQVGGCPYGLAISPCNATDSSVVTAYAGSFIGLIGTSVSSPEFVGALALYEQGAHRQGNFNTFLYKAGVGQTVAGGVSAPAAKQYFHRGMIGYDGVYSANNPSLNYNYIFGNGTPDVRNLFGLTIYPAAGIPQTTTNP